MKTIEYSQFAEVEIRSGTVVQAEPFPKARNPAYKVWVDFGEELGVKKTSAQITEHYELEGLIGKKVMGCVNIGTRNIAGFVSEFLLLGFSDEKGHIFLPEIAKDVHDGEKLH